MSKVVQFSNETLLSKWTHGSIYSVHIKYSKLPRDTVDGRNPAHQVDMVDYPGIYRVLYIQTVVGLGISAPSTVPS